MSLLGSVLGGSAPVNKGSHEYETKKTELEAKLKAVKHIVDYYYGIEGLRIPPAKHPGERTWLEMAHQEFEFDASALDGRNEESIIKNIAHHCACDGIHFTLIYDLVSLFNPGDNNEAGYARIMMACANEIRANKYQYEPHAVQTDSQGPKSSLLDPKRLP